MGVFLLIWIAIIVATCVFATIAGILYYAREQAKLIDSVHERHLSDMRYHMSRFADQILAISEANLQEINGRREIERASIAETRRELERFTAKPVDSDGEFDSLWVEGVEDAI